MNQTVSLARQLSAFERGRPQGDTSVAVNTHTADEHHFDATLVLRCSIVTSCRLGPEASLVCSAF